jgi:hypothetical protein
MVMVERLITGTVAIVSHTLPDLALFIDINNSGEGRERRFLYVLSKCMP